MSSAPVPSPPSSAPASSTPLVPPFLRRSAIVAVLTYLLFGVLWILLSDRVVGWLLHDPESLLLASTLKGWVFVAASAGLIYVLLRRSHDADGQAQALYRLLAENSSDIIWLYDIEKERFLYASPAAFRILGHGPEQLSSLTFEDLLPPEAEREARERMLHRIAALKKGDESKRSATTELAVVSQTGEQIPMEIISTLLTDAKTGRVTRMLGVARDISWRKQEQDRLIRLSQAVEQSPASVVITDLRGTIEYVNPAFEAISGYSRTEAIGQNPRMLSSGHTAPEVYASMWFTLSGGHAWRGELVNRHKSGREFVVNMTIAPVRNAENEIKHYVAVQLDVTSQKDAEDRARRLAWYNPLTGLPNRHRLLLDLKEALQQRRLEVENLDDYSSSELSKAQGALLLLNIDRFQTVNDALGPAAGDQLLQQLSRRFISALPAEAQLAHLNADEFAIFLPAQGGEAGEGGSSAESVISVRALRVAQSLHDVLTAPVQLGRSENITVTCCIGVTLLPHDGESDDGPREDTPEDVLRRADTALHRAKTDRGQEGRTGQTAFFDAEMEQLISHRFLIERDLRRGLAADELRLYLQPQVNNDGDMVSAEALVRWQHPEQGLLPPGTFIPVAEESELITEIGRWVLQGVCEQLGALRARGQRLPIAVNISPSHFRMPNFVHQVQSTLFAHGASPADLIIEITESILVDQPEIVTLKMSQLSSMGVKFSLDDFGTGYSSLAYLKRLPLDELKIDKSFVQDAPTDPNDAALVEAIISVARHLRLKIVAEGVETHAQADFLNERGQIVQQGYLHGRPAPIGEVLANWEARQDL